jgi:hypothetical protein
VTGFKDLRATHLHELDEAAWRDYYPAMAAFLTDAKQETRSSAVERLSMAVFWAEESAERQARREGGGWERDQKSRFAWFRHEIETAHRRFNDIIPAFLKGLRFTGDDWILLTPLRAWLAAVHFNPTMMPRTPNNALGPRFNISFCCKTKTTKFSSVFILAST